MFSYTEPREALLDYGNWLLERDGDWHAVDVAEGQRHGKTVIVRLAGVEDRDQAIALVGAEIGVARAELPETAAGQYYWSDLEGLTVCRRDGTELGRVDHLLETGAHDVMVVRGETERLIPFVSGDVVVDVDLADRVVTVDWDWD